MMNVSLSNFDEKSIYGKNLTLVTAHNETLVLRDEHGDLRTYVDMMSAYGSCNFGHCNSQIVPFEAYPADIAACFYPEEAKDFSEWLTGKLKLPEHEVLYQVGGSAAVSAAISIAQRIKQGKVAYLSGSFHGLGLDALSITNTHKTHALQYTGLLNALAPYGVEIPFGHEVYINWSDISCFVFEPIQGANGYIPLDRQWLNRLIDAAQEHGVVVIADEIQCGYYRHGSLSMAQQLELQPDIHLFSKSMTNGLYPFSAVVYPKAYAEQIQEDLFLAHTFQTSALGCYASMSVARFIDANNIEERCRIVEEFLLNFGRQVSRFEQVKKLYVTGPTLSFEMEGIRGKQLVQACMEKGILIFTGGAKGERVRIAPPVTITPEMLEHSLSEILDSIQSLVLKTGHSLV
ncbi:aminotransferase class III-fold pyridoxal phosphate-dependent enzyme [Paenibacillus sp. JSM ZJ436]|uniref:aminotransferase class III-fold pyridoxal phosphate-dependent enzyme n=1 Tax=Paenibacillus sp. JSM ZJ436 TaxID=3376190 RepID=UPI0037C8DB50